MTASGQLEPFLVRTLEVSLAPKAVVQPNRIRRLKSTQNRPWTVHSITSSARARTKGGMFKPIAFAVFKENPALVHLGHKPLICQSRASVAAIGLARRQGYVCRFQIVVRDQR